MLFVLSIVGGLCCHHRVVCVVFGWFVLPLLSGLCCRHCVVRVVSSGWFVLSSLSGLCCRLWVVCVIILWFVLSCLGGLSCHYWVFCVLVFVWFGVKPEIVNQQINSLPELNKFTHSLVIFPYSCDHNNISYR